MEHSSGPSLSLSFIIWTYQKQADLFKPDSFRSGRGITGFFLLVFPSSLDHLKLYLKHSHQLAHPPSFLFSYQKKILLQTISKKFIRNRILQNWMII